MTKNTINKNIGSLSEDIPSYREIRALFEKMKGLICSGNISEAQLAAKRILRGEPDNRAMLEEIAVFLIDSGDASGAMDVAKILQSRKEYGYGLFLQANGYFMAGALEKAESLCHRALGRGHELQLWQMGAVHHLLAEIMKAQGDMDGAAEEYRKSSSCKTPEGGQLSEYSNYLLSLHYTNHSRMEKLEAAKGYGRIIENIPDLKPFQHNPETHRHEKIKVGYISPDFNRHIVSCFSQCFFRAADTERFEIHGYMLGREDEVTELFKSKAQHWTYLGGMSARQAAQRIYQDEIDILVDLSGHTGNNALPVLAYKPAPIQISGIGYFDTTGLSQVDYFLTDRVTAPAGEEKYFTEKLIRLPESHFCYTPIFPGEEISPAPFQKNGYITFGSMNRLDKLTPEVLLAWSRILHQVQNSRLFLKTGSFDDEKKRTAFFKRLREAGIPEDRVDVEGFTDNYLSAYRKMDIALDSFPYPGGGTTCDSLYMGVPVVTLSGSSHHERFGASILQAAGLGELCGKNIGEYIAAAVNLAGDTHKLAGLHRTLRRKLAESSLMNMKKYMLELEGEYERIFSRYMGKDFEGESGKFAYDRAYKSYRKKSYEAVLYWAERSLNKGFEEILNLRYMQAVALKELGRFEKSLKLCNELLREYPGADDEIKRALLGQRAFLMHNLGCKGTQEAYMELFKLENTLKGCFEAYSSMLLSMNYRDISERELLELHKGYGELVAGMLKPVESPSTLRNTNGKIRVGYISADFRRHVMYPFIRLMLTAYDRDRFEVFAYSLADRTDECGEKLRVQVDAWRDIHGMDYAKAAEIIRKDGLDILFDLGGHSAGSGLPILAFRPAKIQISGLGYMATTGLSQVDYFLTDEYVDPKGIHDELFTEKLLYVKSQFCFSPENEMRESTGAPVKKNGYILFGVFNHYRKFTDEVIRAWGEILRQVPDSKLLIKCQLLYSPENIDTVYAQMESLGVDMDRVIFEPATVEYLSRYLDVDIALDTYPYPGGGTTCDALYMGVPVITRYSSRRSTRFAYGMLSAIGIPELGAETMEGYIEKAVALAQDRELLDMLHRGLRGMMKVSPLMDSKSYMRNLESCYRRIVRDNRKNEK